MRTESQDFLRRLLNTPSPSGGEFRGQRVWLDYVKGFADSVETDAYGNAIAILNPKGTPRIVVSGHGDEIAFQIQYIDADGFIYFSPVGGPDPALARGQRVHIHSAHGVVLGVIGSLAIHMQDHDKKSEAPKWHDLFIDIGAANKKDAEKRVAVGDLITYAVGCEPLHNELWTARGCDNRIGTFVAAEVLRLCSEKKTPNACLIAVSTIQEENGLYGARMIAHSTQPDAAIVVDVAHATDIPIANKKRFGEIKMGQGPVLNRGSVNHPVLVERLAEVGRRHKIQFQRSIDARRTGTDADAIFHERGGIPTAALGIPNRYMHTPVEMIHLEDLETAARWVAAWVMDLKKNETFKVKI